MSKQTRTILKSYFEAKDRPTEAQLIDLIDSMINIDEDSPPRVGLVDGSFTGLGNPRFTTVAEGITWASGLSPVPSVANPVILKGFFKADDTPMDLGGSTLPTGVYFVPINPIREYAAFVSWSSTAVSPTEVKNLFGITPAFVGTSSQATITLTGAGITSTNTVVFLQLDNLVGDEIITTASIGNDVITIQSWNSSQINQDGAEFHILIRTYT